MLIKILLGFINAYPDIEVDVEGNLANVPALGNKAGIRYHERLGQDMSVVQICLRTQRFAIAAAPRYLSSHGRPNNPLELIGHASIVNWYVGGKLAPPL